MKLLIGSDAPSVLGAQTDVRAWTQRILWFADDDDAIVLMDAPDPTFVEHVCQLTGVDPGTLRLHVMPSRWTAGCFDAWSLLDREFQDGLESDAVAASEIRALWPVPEIGWLARSLGVEAKLEGADFWRESGGIWANGKAAFRALASGAGVAVSLGGVCRSIEDAFRLSGHLLQEGRAFMVKRSYGGSGMGNEIVSTEPLDVSHAGHASVEIVEANARSLRAYWERRWVWASIDGAHPVVVEAFVSQARTLYAEVLCTDEGIGPSQIGELKFEDGHIALEVFPAQHVSAAVANDLRCAASRLAQVYRAAGYRGYLSLDSVVAPDGRVYLTEANARFTSSTHLYDRIARKVAGEEPSVVVQATGPKTSTVPDLAAFLAILRQNGLAFNTDTRRGVLAITPVVESTGQLVMAAIAETEEDAAQLLTSTESALTRYGAPRSST